MGTGDGLVSDLRQAVAGLLYRSESDAPFAVFSWPDCADPLSPVEVLAHTGHALGTPVTQQSLEAFFAGLTREKDWYGEEERATARRYRDLRALLARRLPDATVFRVGRVQIEIYVVGHTADGACVGLHTTAVET